MRKSCLSPVLFFSFLVLAPLYGQNKPAPSAAEITAISNKVKELWNIPAMAVTVIQDTQTVYARGFGKLTTAPDAPEANEYTLFVNASTSKAFTAALLAMIADRGFIQWTDPVISHLPDFQMYDPWVTRNYLVQDIMNHKSGFQAQALDPIPALGYGRDDLYLMMRLIKPTFSFRTTYSYCNAAYTTAAKIIEKYSGMTWEEAVKAYIFTPLEMEHSTTGKDSYFTAKNFAYGHSLTKTKEGLKLSPRDDRDDSYAWMQAVSPAAFVMSNAYDMGQWMKMWIGKGTYKGKRLLSPESVDFLFKPQTICSNEQERIVLYAQGWRIEQGVQGKLINHTGLAGGYTAWVVLVPELNLGVSVLMNQGSTTAPHTAIIRQIIDLYRGVESDWITKTYDEYMKPAVPRTPSEEEEYVQPLSPDVYAGDYFKELFGPVRIYEADKTLRIRINDIDAPLHHLNANSFRFHARDEDFTITFEINPVIERAGSFAIDFGDDLGPFLRQYK